MRWWAKEMEVGRLLNFLGMDSDDPKVTAGIDRYRPVSARPNLQGLHFYKGQIGRFRQVIPPDQQAILTEILGPYLECMGYDI